MLFVLRQTMHTLKLAFDLSAFLILTTDFEKTTSCFFTGLYFHVRVSFSTSNFESQHSISALSTTNLFSDYCFQKKKITSYYPDQHILYPRLKIFAIKPYKACNTKRDNIHFSYVHRIWITLNA